MKKLLSLMMVAVLAFSLILSGCAQKAEQAEGDKPQEDQAAAPQETPQEVIELKFNDWNPAGIKATDLWEDVSKMVEEKTNGRVKIKNYVSGSLLKFPEAFKGVSSGLADISLYLMGGAPGVHVINEIYDMPFLGFKNYDQAMRIYSEILEEFPELQAENEEKGVRMLAVRPMLPYHIHSVGKAITLPSDLKGEKVIGTGFLGNVASIPGGIPMQSGPADWYGALQKGVVGHQITHFVVVEEFKLSELIKYHTMFGEGGLANSGLAVLINLDTWNKLTPEDQAVVTEAYNWYMQEIAKYDYEQQNKYIEKMKSEGHEFIELTPEQIEQWKETVGKPTIEKWIEETEAKGLPAQKIYDTIQEKIAADNK